MGESVAQKEQEFVAQKVPTRRQETTSKTKPKKIVAKKDSDLNKEIAKKRMERSQAEKRRKDKLFAATKKGKGKDEGEKEEKKEEKENEREESKGEHKKHNERAKEEEVEDESKIDTESDMVDREIDTADVDDDKSIPDHALHQQDDRE